MALIEAPAASCMFHGGGRSTLSICRGHTLKNLLQHHLLKLAIAIAGANARARPATLDKTVPSRLLPGIDSPKGLLQLASQASKAQQRRSSYRFSGLLGWPTSRPNVLFPEMLEQGFAIVLAWFRTAQAHRGQAGFQSSSSGEMLPWSATAA